MKPLLTELSERPWKLHILVIIAGLALDQYTKYLAVKAYSLPGGVINPFAVTQVVGEWIRLRLVYNPGAAFGLQPQKLLPFLHPTLFYALVSLLAMVILFSFYRRLPVYDKGSQLGIALVLAGAWGNIADRLRLHKVVDFIDVGVPGYAYRWPTFNVADSLVCIGVGCIILWPMIMKKPVTTSETSTSNSSPTPPDTSISGENPTVTNA